MRRLLWLVLGAVAFGQGVTITPKVKITPKVTIAPGVASSHAAVLVGSIWGDGSTNGVVNGGTSTTLTGTATGTGHTFIGFCYTSGGTLLTSVTDGGDTFTVVSIGGNNPQMFYSSAGLTSGKTSLTLNFTSTSGLCAGGEFSGVNTSSAYDVAANAGLSGTTFSVGPTATTAQANEAAFGVLDSVSDFATIVPVAAGYSTLFDLNYAPSGSYGLSAQLQNFTNGPTTYTYSGTSTHATHDGTVFMFKLQ